MTPWNPSLPKYRRPPTPVPVRSPAAGRSLTHPANSGRQPDGATIEVVEVTLCFGLTKLMVVGFMSSISCRRTWKRISTACDTLGSVIDMRA